MFSRYTLGAAALVLTGFLVAVIPAQAQKTKDEVHPTELEKGRWKTSDGIPDGYRRIWKGRYELQTNCDDELSKQTMTHLNSMAKVFKTMLRPRKTLKNRMVVKLFRTRKHFMDYGAPAGAAAYFSPSIGEMVGYDTGVAGGKVRSQATSGGKNTFEEWRQRNSMDVLGVMCHEGWHQYFHYNCGSKVHFPAWCDEGIAEYFYSAYVDPKNKKKFIVGSPNDIRLATIQRALLGDAITPLEMFVQYEQRRYYANSSLHYAQGALFVHFLMEHPKYKKKKYVPRFVSVFLDQHSIKKTIPQVFGKKPKWDRMTKDYKDWTLAIPRVVDPISPMAELTKQFNVEAKKRFDALEPAVRKALQACLDKRAQTPWQAQAKAKAKAKAKAEEPASAN